jgi:arginase
MSIDVLVVPYDSGKRSERMGAGPQALIDAGLISRLEAHGHDVRRRVIDPPVGAWRAEIRTAFDLATALAAATHDAVSAGRFPLVLSGNCGVAALGICAALGSATAILWADAHGEFNTPETTIGGFLDGMGLAILTGRCWTTIARRIPGFVPLDERRIWLLGARDLDPLEAEALEHSAIHRIPAEAIGSSVVGAITGIERAAPLYVHLDVDVLDVNEGRANEFAVAGGASATQLTALCAALRSDRPPAAMTVSSYDPEADTDGRAREAVFHAVEAMFDHR